MDGSSDQGQELWIDAGLICLDTTRYFLRAKSCEKSKPLNKMAISFLI